MAAGGLAGHTQPAARQLARHSRLPVGRICIYPPHTRPQKAGSSAAAPRPRPPPSAPPPALRPAREARPRLRVTLDDGGHAHSPPHWHWQEAEEKAQLYHACAFLLQQYPHKTFVFENWEGDW